jgi:hypothetical protein
MANIPYPNIPYPRLSCWWVLNFFCDKRYQITFKIQDDDIYKMLDFLIDNIFVQCGGHVLQHLICIKIGTVCPTHQLVSSLLQGRLNRSCQDERTASGSVSYGILNPMVNWTRGQFTSMVYWTPLLKTEPPCMVNWTLMVFWPPPHF